MILLFHLQNPNLHPHSPHTQLNATAASDPSRKTSLSPVVQTCHYSEQVQRFGGCLFPSKPSHPLSTFFFHPEFSQGSEILAGFLSYRIYHFKDFFCVYRCFAYKYVCIPYVCLGPLEARRRHQIPRNWTYRWLWNTVHILGLELLEGEQVFLTAEISLQHQYLFLKVMYVCHVSGDIRVSSEAAESRELNHNWLQANCGGGVGTRNQP